MNQQSTSSSAANAGVPFVSIMSWNNIESFSNNSSQLERLIEDYQVSEQTKMTRKNKIVFGLAVAFFVVVVICAWVMGTANSMHHDDDYRCGENDGAKP